MAKLDHVIAGLFSLLLSVGCFYMGGQFIGDLVASEKTLWNVVWLVLFAVVFLGAGLVFGAFALGLLGIISVGEPRAAAGRLPPPEDTVGDIDDGDDEGGV